MVCTGTGQCLVDVAVVAQPAVAVLLGHRCHDGIHHRRRGGRVAGLGPVALHGLRGLEGAPGVVGDDGDAAGQLDTFNTPRIARAAVASNLTSAAPIAGFMRTVANTMSGSRTSIPKVAVP
ncbi:hypothetical protein, partial [Aquabacterium sp.]|uniref:hypothetical protein n=1 Tax=Aquabacterium sp. TaxID=1872578 RepID=UPI002CC221E7